MTSKLYLITSLGGNPSRDHHALYLEAPCTPPLSSATNLNTASVLPLFGYIFHVTGTIATGMTYETRTQHCTPEDELGFLSKKLLGVVTVGFEDVNEVCRNISPPEKQFEGFKRIDKGKPLRRCQEWVEEVVQALREKELLRDDVGGG